MSEADIMQSLFASIQVVNSIFSVFFGVISAYIAGLYFFLNRAPLTLRLLAFVLLSAGLAFLGGSALLQQSIQESLFAALGNLPSPTVPLEVLQNPLAFSLPTGWSLQEVGITIGWTTALSVYLALGYMTFLYRWDIRGAVRRAAEGGVA